MNILRVKDENGNWIDIPAIKGDKGDKGESGDITPELEALRDQVTEAANRAEDAAAALEGGLVLRKGNGLDSVVLAVSDAKEKPAAAPAANGETAISLGRYCVVGTEEAVATNEKAGKNAMAVNYKNTVNGERAFAANGYNTITETGQYAAAFGYGNTVSAERAFACGSANEVSGNRAFSAGTSNKVKAINGFAAGQSNTVNAENGFVCGNANTLTGKNSFSTGNENHVNGLNGFASGFSNTIEDTAMDAAAVGSRNTIRGNDSFAAGGYNVLNGAGNLAGGSFHEIDTQYAASLGNRNKVDAPSGMAFGEVLRVTERAQVAVGRANDYDSAALFMVGNGTYEVAEDGAPATNVQRSNAFEVHDNRIVVGGLALPGEMLKYHYDGYAELELSDAAMVDQCIAWFNVLGDSHFGRYVLNKAGQVFFVEIYRATAQWGVIKLTQYNISGGAATVKYGSIAEGLFTGFTGVSFDDHNHDDHYYTEEEIDEKFSNVSSGGSAGMLREFSDANTAGSYTTTGNKSKFYIVTLTIVGYTYSLTVDYKSVSATTSKFRLFSVPGTNCTLKVTINSNDTVTFELSTAGTIDHVTGYY